MKVINPDEMMKILGYLNLPKTEGKWECVYVYNEQQPLVQVLLFDGTKTLKLTFHVLQPTEKCASMWEVTNSENEKVLFHSSDLFRAERANNNKTPKEVMVVMDKSYFIGTWQFADNFAHSIGAEDTSLIKNINNLAIKQKLVLVENETVVSEEFQFIETMVNLFPSIPADGKLPKFICEEIRIKTNESSLNGGISHHAQ